MLSVNYISVKLRGNPLQNKINNKMAKMETNRATAH